MKKTLFLILALCFAGVGYRFHTKAKQRITRGFKDNLSEGTPGERAARLWTVLNWQPRLAPEGTYFLTGYVSVPTSSGPIGLLPGQALRVEREQGHQVVLAAPSGTSAAEFTLPRGALTDDLDMAANLASIDQAAHQDFRERLVAEESSREREKQSLYEAAAANIAAAESARMAAEPIGARSSLLQHGSTPRGGYYRSVAPVIVYAPNGIGTATARTPPPRPTPTVAASSCPRRRRHNRARAGLSDRALPPDRSRRDNGLLPCLRPHFSLAPGADPGKQGENGRGGCETSRQRPRSLRGYPRQPYLTFIPGCTLHQHQGRSPARARCDHPEPARYRRRAGVRPPYLLRGP